MDQSKRNKYKYLLLLKEDLSGHIWLVPCETAGAKETGDALIHWFATFGVVLQWFSDQWAHFKNQIMLCLQKKLKAKHHFTTAHCPWANGTIESACKQVIRVSRALLSDLKMSVDDWDKVVPVIQSVLNNSPASRLQNRTPMYVFTSHKDTTPLALILEGVKEVEIASFDFIKAQKLIEMEKTAKIMAEIHTQVVAQSTKTRTRAIDADNRKTHVQAPNFEVGYYVLITDPIKQGRSKLQVKRKGPRRIVGVESELVYVVENLTTKDVKAVHANFMRFYKEKSLNVTEELERAAEHNEHRRFVVSKLLGLRCNDEEIRHEVQVVWRGFPVADADWQPYDVMGVDVPEMMSKFLDVHNDKEIKRLVRSL
jgi:hypothetical protein